ncbi:uncharacterized protein LOC142765396 [Rhipicephalus microplus]|uniref:uncharacterized protein LOC142765396 n=1 Tax=Rhipicephalus microplus TaxID=6941 RepID=UPI003F6D1CE8
MLIFALQDKATFLATTVILTDRTKEQWERPLNITDRTTEKWFPSSDDTDSTDNTNSPIPHKECDTRDCIYMGRYLSAWINRNADPCDDFYEYVCSKIRSIGILKYDKVLDDDVPDDGKSWSVVFFLYSCERTATTEVSSHRVVMLGLKYF